MKIIQIGLDFGTTNTGISARFEDGSITLLKDKGVNMKSFPSEIYFINRDTFFVGAEAQKQAESYKGNGRHIRWIKRSLPKKLDAINIFSKMYLVEDLVAIIIKYAKEKIEKSYSINWDEISLKVGYPVVLGEDNEESEIAKERMNKALRLAGFNNWELVPEPVAVAHFYSNKIENGKKCLIFDCGGGTTDLSFVEYNKNIKNGFKIFGNTGIMRAGREFDKTLFMKSLAPHLGYRMLYNFMGEEMEVPRTIYDTLSNPAEAQRLVSYKHHKHIMLAVNIAKSEEFLNLRFAVDNNQSTYLLGKSEDLKIDLSTNETAQKSISLKSSFNAYSTYDDLDKASIFVQEVIINMINHFCSDKPMPDLVIMTGGMSKHMLIKNLVFNQFKSIPSDSFLYEDTDAIVLGLAAMG